MRLSMSPPAVIQELHFSTMLLLSSLNGEESSLLLVCFCCQSGVSESFLLCVAGQKLKVQVDKNSTTLCVLLLTPQNDGLLLIWVVGVALKLISAGHYTTTLQSDAIVLLE